MVTVAMAMAMGMAEGNRHAIGLTGTGAFALAEGATLGESFHVVVVAVLGSPHLHLKAKHLGPVFA
jgi:hypothetical protein